MDTEKIFQSEEQSRFNDVDKLFDQVTTLSKDEQKAFLEKIRSRLANHEKEICQSKTETEKKGKTTSTTQRTRKSVRKKKCTEEVQAFIDDVHSVRTRKSVRKKKCTEEVQAFIDDVHSVESSVQPHSIKSCFVKLCPLEKSISDTSKLHKVQDERNFIKYEFDFDLSDSDIYQNDVDDPDTCEEFDPDDDDDDDDDEFRPSTYSKKKRHSAGNTKIKKAAKKLEPEGDFKCSDCSFTSHFERALKRHSRRHIKETFVCERCGKSFTQKSALNVHLKRHYGIKNFECSLCDFRAVSKLDIVRHMPKHTGQRNFACEFCGKLFTTDNSLRNHIRCVHKKSEIFPCNICSFHTHSRDILRRHHLVQHTEREQFECPVCHEIVKQKGTFLIHMRKHTGERPYFCDQCSKSFKSNSQLAKHRLIHRPGKHKCSSCNKLFRTKHHLARHTIIHTGTKPYICHLCTYTCNVKGNITKHIKSVHKVSSFTFKEPYPTGNGENTPLNALEENTPLNALDRGSKVTDEYLKDYTQKAGEILTLDDLKRQSSENQQQQQEAKLDELKNKKLKKKKTSSEVSEATSLSHPEASVVNGDCELQGCEVVESDNVTIPVVSGDMCSPDILSDAVQMLGTQVQDVTDICNGRSECVSETMNIPFEIGPNMFIIQVLPDENISY